MQAWADRACRPSSAAETGRRYAKPRTGNYLTIEDILEIEPPADPFDGPRCDDVGSFDEVEEKAGALRRLWNLGFDPAPSVTALLEDRGIKVVLADLPARCDGLACGVARGGGRPDTEAVVWRALGEELISPVRAAELLGRALSDVEREIRGPCDR